MNITAITTQVQQKGTGTSVKPPAFGQQPYLQRAAKDKQGSILNQIAERMTDKFEQAEALESKRDRRKNCVNDKKR